jgi:hypothetical protein
MLSKWKSLKWNIQLDTLLLPGFILGSGFGNIIFISKMVQLKEKECRVDLAIKGKFDFAYD